MSKQLKWNKFPFYGNRLSMGKIFTGLTSPDNKSEKINQAEQCRLIRRQVVWRKYTEQMTEKQNSVKTGTRSLKKETPPIYGIRCSTDQKRKS